MNDELFNKALCAVLNNIGGLIALYFNQADFSKINEFKKYVADIFDAADAEIAKHKTKENTPQFN